MPERSLQKLNTAFSGVAFNLKNFKYYSQPPRQHARFLCCG